MKNGFLIAAPTSGSGKTTVARGLMALFRRKGYRVQPFKCGPDYIDTKFHERVCGRPSINLDTFMASEEHVRHLFRHYGADADVCIVEGMMGLFDGYDRWRGSAYEIARVLGLPVVLVVDARSAAYSVAPLLYGFLHFREDVRIAGVIYNKVGSERHAKMLRQVSDDLGVTCLGCLPKQKELEVEGRYLGLNFSIGLPRTNTESSLGNGLPRTDTGGALGNGLPRTDTEGSLGNGLPRTDTEGELFERFIAWEQLLAFHATSPLPRHSPCNDEFCSGLQENVQSVPSSPCPPLSARCNETSPCQPVSARCDEAAPCQPVSARCDEAAPCQPVSARCNETSPCPPVSARCDETSPCQPVSARCDEAAPCQPVSARCHEAAPCPPVSARCHETTPWQCEKALVARNAESFSFVYQETLDRLGNVTFFDPEKDVPCLDNIDLLYLPGGYPEKHADALVANEACRQAIRQYALRGGHIVAECGGMMYLCQRILTDEGDYPMCGVLPYTITARKADRRLSLGYRQFTLDGVEYRGHEFHYSQFLGEIPPSAVQVYDAKGQPVPTPVFRYHNVLASYTHLYPV